MPGPDDQGELSVDRLDVWLVHEPLRRATGCRAEVTRPYVNGFAGKRLASGDGEPGPLDPGDRGGLDDGGPLIPRAADERDIGTVGAVALEVADRGIDVLPAARVCRCRGRYELGDLRDRPRHRVDGVAARPRLVRSQQATVLIGKDCRRH